MTSTEALAIAALRRWAYDRAALLRGRCAGLQAPRPGRRPANAGEQQRTQYAGRLVRVIDFEKVFALLDPEHQAVLLAVYKDRLGDTAAAAILGCSIRKVSYLKVNALANLADALDRRSLL